MGACRPCKNRPGKPAAAADSGSECTAGLRSPANDETACCGRIGIATWIGRPLRRATSDPGDARRQSAFATGARSTRFCVPQQPSGVAIVSLQITAACPCQMSGGQVATLANRRRGAGTLDSLAGVRHALARYRCPETGRSVVWWWKVAATFAERRQHLRYIVRRITQLTGFMDQSRRQSQLVGCTAVLVRGDSTGGSCAPSATSSRWA